jgi:uncharacterized membrane protein YdjX (TVP38/TMEM64 family)
MKVADKTLATRSMRPSWLRGLAVLAALAIFLGAQRAGLFARLRDPSAVVLAIAQVGPLGMLAFLLAFAFLQPFGIPGTVFLVASALIWPWPTAFALSLSGSMAASVVGVSFARYVFRDAVSKRIPQRFLRYEALLQARALRTVFALRFVFWTSPLLHGFLGVSRVPLWTHFWGSLLGYVLPVFLMTYFGARAAGALRGLAAQVTAHPGPAASVALGVAVGAFALWRLRVRRRAGGGHSASNPPA